MPELMHIPTHRYTTSDQPLAHTYGVQHDISNILEGKSQANGCIHHIIKKLVYPEWQTSSFHYNRESIKNHITYFHSLLKKG